MTTPKNTELLPLASCNAHQLTVKGKKEDWLIRENVTGVTLATLSNRITDHDIMAMIHFARKYELEAFNKGIDFQKNKQNVFFKDKIAQLTMENERLAQALEQETRNLEVN